MKSTFREFVRNYIIIILSLSLSSKIYGQIAWPDDGSTPIEITRSQMYQEYDAAMEFLEMSIQKPLQHVPQIDFKLVAITEANIENFRSYIEKEKSLCRITDDFIHYNIILKDFENQGTMQDIMHLVKEQHGLFKTLEEPTMNALDMLNSPLPPHGLYMAMFLDVNNPDQEGRPSIVMSVMALPGTDKEFQFHQYIFRSPSYKFRAYVGGQKEISGLSMDLHKCVLRSLGSKYCATRPLPVMGRILKENGFNCISRDSVEALLGPQCYEYERKYGIKDSYMDFYYGT